MTNLVDEFFKRNLTEAESRALEELLGNSPEEALKFAQKLQGEYLAMGLTVPQAPKHFRLKAPKGAGALLKTLVAVAALAGAGAWWLWYPRVVPSVPAVKSTRSQILARLKAKLPPPPVEIPQKLRSSSLEGSRLSVVVELDRPAPVEVMILDSKERQVRALYQGNLQAGKWSLHWDGLLSDGSKAPSGNYQILVRSGSTKMSKKVSIEAGK